MTDDENLVKRLAKSSRELLRSAMDSTGFSAAIEAVIDEEDGSTYYVIAKGAKLSEADILVVDDALIEVAKLYKDAEQKNTSKYYRKVGRMVFYALYELESRDILEHEINSWLDKYVMKDE